MITLEKIVFLKSMPLFKLVKEESLFALACILEHEIIEPGELIIQKGDLGNTMYMIVDGKVKVHDESRVIKELETKEIFGELAALFPEKRIASVSAMQRTILLKIESTPLYELMDGDIELTKGIVQILCQRIRSLSKDLESQGWRIAHVKVSEK